MLYSEYTTSCFMANTKCRMTQRSKQARLRGVTPTCIFCMVQMCRWNSPHFSGYLYINKSWFNLRYTFIALHSVTSCAKSDHLTWPLSLQVIFLLSDKNQFMFQYLTIMLVFCMNLFSLNGNNEPLLLSSFMPRGIYFSSFHSSVGMFVRSYFHPVRGITSKFYVQATRAEYISPTTHQKAFIFGP